MQTEWNRSIKALRNSLFPVNFIFYSELFQFLCILVEGYQYRSSRPDVLFKKVVLKGLSKFIGKHLCQSLFFNKVAGLRPATEIKKETLTQVFSCEFCQIFKYAFFKGHLRWLPLSILIHEVLQNRQFYIFSIKCSALMFSEEHIYLNFPGKRSFDSF